MWSKYAQIGAFVPSLPIHTVSTIACFTQHLMQLRIVHTLSLMLVTTVLVTVLAMAGVAAWNL